MSYQEYEYRGLMASTWDLLRGDTSRWADRFFYLELIQKSGQPVLDVGCGTGRLLLDYMAQGIDIDGVDNSPEMLALCRQKAAAMGLQPKLYLQTMESLDLPHQYQTILVPSSSFQLVTDPTMAQEAMSRFFAHLQSGGTLAMPFMILWRPGEPLQTEWKRISETVRPQDGALVRRWSRSRYDPADQTEHTEDRYEILRDGEMMATEHHQRSPATRGYTQAQAVSLYQEAGFQQVVVYHEFTFEPAAEDDALFTVVGHKP